MPLADAGSRLAAAREALAAFRERDAADAAAAREGVGRRAFFVHVHVPKCAGSSFNDLLRRSFGPAHVEAYSPLPDSAYSPGEFEQIVAAHPQGVCFASHSFRLFPRQVAGRRPLYVGFVRDPLEWFVSNMTYLIANYSRLSEQHRARLPRDCERLTVRELAEQLLDRRERENRAQSDMVNFIAAPTFAREIAPRVPAEGLSAGDRDAILTELACYLVDQFFFVGVVEEMPRLLPGLRERLGELGIHLLPETMPSLNVSRERRGDLSWLTEVDPVGRRILVWVRRDRKLYEHVLARMEATVAA